MSSSASPPLDLARFIDDRRLSPVQYGVIGLCSVVMFLDGFDTQAISYIAPHIAREWKLSTAALGPIFSAALTGLMVGYLALSPLSERFGHKRVLTVSTVCFAVCTLAAAWSHNVGELMALRFATGVGLGAAAPSAVALTAEFSPKRLRASAVLVIYCGFSLGFVVAGMVSGWLIPSLGWRSVFWVGALAPLLLVPALLLWLPDSLTFMLRRGADPRRLSRILRRIDRNMPEDALSSPATAPAAGDDAPRGSRKVALLALFRRDQLAGTVLLWLVFMVNLGEFYALQSWLPTILTNLHYPMSTVVTTTSLISVGGIVAALLTGPAMDRLGAYGTLAAVYLVGFVFVAATGLALHAPLWVLLGATFLAGCCISGGQKSLIALAAVFYPAQIRSTGVGWALGIGRVGGILGPILVGAALSMKWSPSTVFYALAVPVLVAGFGTLLLGRRYGRAATAPAPAASTSLARR